MRACIFASTRLVRPLSQSSASPLFLKLLITIGCKQIADRSQLLQPTQLGRFRMLRYRCGVAWQGDFAARMCERLLEAGDQSAAEGAALVLRSPARMYRFCFCGHAAMPPA